MCTYTQRDTYIHKHIHDYVVLKQSISMPSQKWMGHLVWKEYLLLIIKLICIIYTYAGTFYHRQ